MKAGGWDKPAFLVAFGGESRVPRLKGEASVRESVLGIDAMSASGLLYRVMLNLRPTSVNAAPG